MIFPPSKSIIFFHNQANRKRVESVARPEATQKSPRPRITLRYHRPTTENRAHKFCAENLRNSIGSWFSHWQEQFISQVCQINYRRFCTRQKLLEPDITYIFANEIINLNFQIQSVSCSKRSLSLAHFLTLECLA